MSEIYKVDNVVPSLAFMHEAYFYAVLEEIRLALASSYELASQLSRKDWRAAIPVVAFSSSGEDIRHDDCLHRGISDFLLPPFSIDLAVKRIHNATRSKELL